ncbi:MAG: hypothetical protein ACRD8O_22565 [Bryobacteraceae bacterium]
MTTEGRITLRGFCMALAVAVALVVIFWIQYPPRYLTNDDVVIRLGVEGKAFPGERATGFVLVTHSVLGWSLVWAHRLLPAAPLWDLMVVATLLGSLAVLFGLVWASLGKGWVARLTAMSAMGVVAFPLVANLQFTIGATLAGAASVLLAAAELASTRPRRSVMIISAVLLMAGLLERPMGAAAGGLIVGLFLIPWAVWRASFQGARVRYIAALFGVIILLSAGLMYVDGLLYRGDRAWDAYYRYIWMAAQLVEWGGDLPADDITAIRAAAGWTSNDWAMLQRWLAVDPAVHGFERVTKAYEARSSLMPWDAWWSWMTQNAASISGSTLRHVGIESALPLFVILTVTTVYARWRGRVAVAIGILIFCVVCIAIEARFKELPFRLLAPLQAGVVAAVIVIAGTLRREPSVAIAIAGLAVILAVLTSQTRSLLEAAGRDHRHTAQVEQEVRELLRLSPSLVVIHADAFPSEHWWRPFVQPPVTLQAISLDTINPLMQEFLNRTGRQPIFRAICEDPSILVISEADRLDLVRTYFREHFNRTIGWTQVYSGSFRAWRCVG